MTARSAWGTVAAVSAIAFLILAVFSSVAGNPWSARGMTMGGSMAGASMGVGMMGGTGMTGMSAGMAGMAGGTGMMGGSGMAGMAGGAGMMGGGHMTPGGVTRSVIAPIPGAPTVTVTASEFRFSPAEITLPSREANLTLVNSGSVAHDLVVPALGIRVVANAGQTTTVGLRDLPAGRYAGTCGIPGHADAGMRITVTVQ
jgi:heme/copper-type cytochrome/quinol oxidase subunit 2